jgi:hypothetical protein
MSRKFPQSFRISALSVAVMAGCLSSTAQAEDWLFVPSVAYQQKELSFDQRYSGADTNRADFSASLPVLSFGFSAVKDKFFISLKHESNVSDTPTTTDETDRSQTLQFNLMAVAGSQVDIARQDQSLTVGYNVWRRLNLFAGYLDGETDVKPEPFCADPGQVEGFICTRVNRAFQQFFLGDNGFVPNQPEYIQSYSESGPFIGASYAFEVADYGSLSLSLAYASMDGEFRDNANDPDNAFQDENGAANFVAFHYSGDSVGTSIAATWTGSLGDRAGYFFDVRRQSYSMDAEDQTGLPFYEGISLSTDETMTGVAAGMNLYF